jgi:hypothetical protein
MVFLRKSSIAKRYVDIYCYFPKDEDVNCAFAIAGAGIRSQDLNQSFGLRFS